MLLLILALLILGALFWFDYKDDKRSSTTYFYIPYVGSIKYWRTLYGVLSFLFIIFAR